ncbi:M20 aminoacylase family protein [Pseudomonas monteilii]|uniref:M20 aminoacylase family protein n=1 Tax=Pseudomonas monteilii TaxID=76759 RepID=UPI001CBD8467|nr:M20 aminoacylase family protein [Pseudomonas monteilii]MBZ3666670.1 amidohydrolase [Pseudomonas monteilii]MBZ3672036.1 amidohydrolase [Pseudomonas monteilii]
MNHVLADIKEFQQELIAIRRDIHKHPETAFEEHRTSQLIADRLTQWGLEIHRGLAKTGVVGTLVGRSPGITIGLRADLDALNIEEHSLRDHKSIHEGKMHACGHDGHTAMLLGAARYFSLNRDFPGIIHFIFQPAEEGQGGGRVMIEEGLFKLFPCDMVFGMHNMPGIAAGDFAICPGPIMAASDTWTVTFSGSGGHGSMPHLATDATLAGANFITGIQSIISRNVAPSDSAVLSVGYVHGGHYNSANVIPSSVVVRGTARSFLPETRDLLERRMTEISQACAAANGCEVEFEYLRRYPPVINAAVQTELAVSAAGLTVGEGRVNTELKPLTAGEDFSFMIHEVPGAYILIGNGRDDGYAANIHTPEFDFNDSILATGSAYWVNLVKVANC